MNIRFTIIYKRLYKMITTLRKILLLVAVVITLSPITSFAVPSYARQTGMNCAACHTSFPELTPFGREFKLNGYTLGEQQLFPIAAMMQFSVTNVAKNHDNSGAQLMPHQNDLDFPRFSRQLIMSEITKRKLNERHQIYRRV